MSTSQTLLIVCCLLQSALCKEFKVTVPQDIEVLRGSCVTIPCSFDIRSEYEVELDNTCKAIWIAGGYIVFDSVGKKERGELQGNLGQKNCTTTLNNVQLRDRNTYQFRLQCDNPLKNSFTNAEVKISVKGDPTSPTVTPSTLEVKEGTPVSLKCSAAAPCLTHPPTLTWTPSVGDVQETLLEDRLEKRVMTSVMNFSALYLHHGKTISCTATYRRQDGSNEISAQTDLTPDVSFVPVAPEILLSSDCSRTSDQLYCSCETVGKPSPTIRWYLDGLAVSHSDNFSISHETLNGTTLRSIITVNQTRSGDLSTLLCRSSNSEGSTSQCFSVNSIEHQTFQSQVVPVAPEILLSSDCNRTSDQLYCSCETVGKPSPTIRWYLDGLAVSHSDNFSISHETLNGTTLRSIITVNQTRSGDLSTLLCRSSNSVGSASQRFSARPLVSWSLCPWARHFTHLALYQVTIPVLVTTVIALLVVVCVLLFVIRTLKTHCKRPDGQSAGGARTASTDHRLTSREGQEVPVTESVQVDTNGQRQAEVAQQATISETSNTTVPESGPDDAEKACKSSEKTNEEDADVIYTNVTWKRRSTKQKRVDSVDRQPPSDSYLEEERCVAGEACGGFLSQALEMQALYDGVEKKDVEPEYAQVKFKDRRPVDI